MGFFDKKINSWAEKLERSINRLSEEMTSGLESFNVDGLLSSAMGRRAASLLLRRFRSNRRALTISGIWSSRSPLRSRGLPL